MSERHDLVFSHAANRHGVHLNRIETDLLRCLNPLDHLFVAFAAGDLFEPHGVECIEADVDSP